MITQPEQKQSWGPAWLSKKADAPKPTPAPAPKIVVDAPADFAAYNEQCWANIEPQAYAYLTRPRNYPAACPWCGGRLVHDPFCDELRIGWQPTVPWGRYRGKPIAQVPRDYLEWMMGQPSLPVEFVEAVRLCRN